MSSSSSRVLAFGLGVLGLAAFAQPVHAGSASNADALGCDERVHDPEGVLDVDELNSDILRTVFTGAA